MPDWDIAVGETLPRSELHDRWGGGRQGGIEAAVKAHSVFLFTKPSVGESYGYNYDGWHKDGAYNHTGDGQVGDQSPDKGGNRDLLNAPNQRRAIRLFRSQDKNTTYIGQFQLADPLWYWADAPDRYKEMRKVLVFRLTPVETIAGDLVPEAVDPSNPEELPLEASNFNEYVINRPEEPPNAVRREAELVKQYAEWLALRGEQTVRHRIPLPPGGYLYTDVFNKALGELIEAKASVARIYIRAGLGQLLDYSRFVSHISRALLLPSRPTDDLVDLLHEHGVGLIWKNGDSFDREMPT